MSAVLKDPSTWPGLIAGCLPGAFVLSTGLAVPPGRQFLFGLFLLAAGVVGVLILLAVRYRRAVRQNAIALAVAGLLVFLICLMVYGFVYARSVIVSNEKAPGYDRPVYFPLTLRDRPAILEEKLGRQKMVDRYGPEEVVRQLAAMSGSDLAFFLTDLALVTPLTVAFLGLMAAVGVLSFHVFERRQTRKMDAYLELTAPRPPEDTHAPGDDRGTSEPIRIPLLLQLKKPEGWRPPQGFEVHTRIGSIVSGSGTQAALERLRADSNVVSVEASRAAGIFECAQSVPFVRADRVHRQNPSEKGEYALVAVIDSGIDVLHKAFTSDDGTCRIVEIWDQTDDTGPTPRALYGEAFPNYGTVHREADVREYVARRQAPARLGRDAEQHGTHVASIAAGRAVGPFAGGVAPLAKIAVVIPKIRVRFRDPFSMGYSTSHANALGYIDEVARRRGLPVVVNISLGMNAGAHDGTALLEVAIDQFTANGTKEGRVVVKSAGNERTLRGHARLVMRPGLQETLPWHALAEDRAEDLIELWFEPGDRLKLRLRGPGGQVSEPCTSSNVKVSGTFPSNNEYTLNYDRYYTNGDSRVLVVVRPGTAARIEPGEWALLIEGEEVGSQGVVHGWIERLDTRPTSFTDHVDDDVTLSIPGTARTVITVAGVSPTIPMQLTSGSSYGLTRDGRAKPDLCAPGEQIQAARAGTEEGVVAMTGTSMAAPHVAGAVALVMSRRRQRGGQVPSAAMLTAALCDCAQYRNPQHSANLGYGLVDAEALLREFP